jgi:hypothetical protein
MPLCEQTDSEYFFFTVTQCNELREKHPSIEVAVVREAYAKCKFANIGFVRTAHSLVDQMTQHAKTRT